MGIALDIAASEFGRGGRYKLALEARELDSAGMIELLTGWIARYPILSIEDPLAEDDLRGIRRVHPAQWAIVADRRRRLPGQRRGPGARCRGAGAANTVLLKPNQRGTLTETFDAWRAAAELGYAAIVSARSGETEDITIAHLAVGWGAGQLKVGSFARGERMAKWNEMLRIEEALGGKARFAGGCGIGPVAAVKVVFHAAAGPDLAARLAALPGLDVAVCPEDDDGDCCFAAAGL